MPVPAGRRQGETMIGPRPTASALGKRTLCRRSSQASCRNNYNLTSGLEIINKIYKLKMILEARGLLRDCPDRSLAMTLPQVIATRVIYRGNIPVVAEAISILALPGGF
jgi:hypothetical protein